MSERPFDSARARGHLDSHITGERVLNPLYERGKIEMIGEAPERPVSSQLTRIETSVAALNANHKGLAEQAAMIFEGQARLNGIIDGLGALWHNETKEQLARLNGLVDGLQKEMLHQFSVLIIPILETLERSKSCFRKLDCDIFDYADCARKRFDALEGKLAALEGRIDARWAETQRKMSAIEAKLESGAKFDVVALNELKRYIGVTCSGELEAKRKVWKAYVDKRIRQRASKKPPSKKAQR